MFTQDGAEFQGSLQGWGVPHSDATLGGYRTLGGNYWALAQAQASLQSSALWNQRTAVEGGGGAGLGPWKEDMAPFADEATIKGPLCGSGGDSWHEDILLRSLNSGIMLNGYHTSVSLPLPELDCFIGGLVATGIAPQMSGSGSLPNPAFKKQLARVKFWLDLYKTHGMATESTIDALHYPDVFLVGLRGGTANSSSYGLLVGATVGVPLPSTLDNNSTVLTYQGVEASSVNLSLPAPTSLTSITFFAANNLTLVLAGNFWRRAITQTIVDLNGTTSTSVVPASAGGVTLQAQLGQHVRFSVASGAVAAKSDDETLGSPRQHQIAGHKANSIGSHPRSLKNDDVTVATTERPSILFCSPAGPDQSTPANVVDLAYLAKLHNLKNGFEVDWTSDLTDVTQERLWKYNAVVVFCEGARRCAGGFDNDPSPTNMPALLAKYASAGGGVLLLPSEMNVAEQMLQNTTKLFGAELPAELIVQGNWVPGQWPDSSLGVGMINMPGVTMAYSDNIPASPVSAGVKGIWYPTSMHYNAQDTNCLILPSPWTSVLKAAKGSFTEPIQFNPRNQHLKGGWPMPPGPTDAPVRPNRSVHEPDLMGVREFGSGRVALLALWDQFLFGSGNKWLFGGQILSSGDGKGRPSDTETLVLNTLRWLAAPSLRNKSSGLGGYITTPDRLQYPNMQAKNMDKLNETHYQYDKSALSNDPAAGDGSIVFSGLIGAQSSHGGGKSTVQEYAAAAAASGISFLAFLEPYTSLTNASFAALVADCAKYSTPSLLLWAGWSIDTNIGDHYFGYGREPQLPPPQLVDSSSRFIIQPPDPKDPRNFTGMNGPSFSWLLAPVQNNDRAWNTGYYNFSSTTGTLEPYDLRAYGQLALQLWHDGKLVEDNTDGYLTTVESTMIGAPIALHQISTTAMLTEAISKKQGLTFVVKDPGWSGTGLNDSLPNIWSPVGLAWNDQYDNQQIFTSSGPLIKRFPCTMSCQSRIWTLGAERCGR